MNNPTEKQQETEINKLSTIQTSRISIEHVSPQIDGGLFPIKRTAGEEVIVTANVFADGHDEVFSQLLFRTDQEKNWHVVEMKPTDNDCWIGSFPINENLDYFYTVRGFIHTFNSWSHDFQKKVQAQQEVSVDLMMGAHIIEQTYHRIIGKDKKSLKQVIEKLNHPKDISLAIQAVLDETVLQIMTKHLDPQKSFVYPKKLRVNVERKLALFSSWYELFPRSWSHKRGEHGTFKDCERLLPEIARMGFNVLYLPPIHPIGQTHRKGKNNSKKCLKTDPGCPWAIGSKEGGHKSIHPQLGTLDTFKNFIKAAQKHDIEIALDLAYQCSQDHPYVKEHPQWFKWRPDGSVQCAENPPKIYEDILPLNFETEDWKNLWLELKDIVLFWIKQGVRIFRVDNPHTKPFVFWDWLISEIKKDYPETIFLSEAFTRPNVMYRLAKAGFSQSYTYFTWRNTKSEFIDYMTELSQSEMAEYMRPNFWTNTPDILPKHLEHGGRPAFIMRAVLAATLSSNFGIYGPAFELCVAKACTDKEEYVNNEKYEIKNWDWEQKGNLKKILTQLNMIRQNNPCLQFTRNLKFCEIDNDNLLAYYKSNKDLSNVLLFIVNLDPHNIQSGWLNVPSEILSLLDNKAYIASDLLNDKKYKWQYERNYIELNPQVSPAHIFQFNKISAGKKKQTSI